MPHVTEDLILVCELGWWLVGFHFLLSSSFLPPLLLFEAHHLCSRTQITLISKNGSEIASLQVLLSGFVFLFFSSFNTLCKTTCNLGSCLNFSSHRGKDSRASICQKAGVIELDHTCPAECLLDDRLVCPPTLSLETFDLIPSRPPLVA